MKSTSILTLATLFSLGVAPVVADIMVGGAAMPDGTVDTLLKEENKETLAGVLTYHVVAGKYTAEDVMKAIKKGDGKVEMKTLAGGTLTFSMNGPMNVVVTDAKGGTANISTYDVLQKNGVIHVIARVLMP